MDSADNMKSAKFCKEKSRTNNVPSLKNYKYHVWEYVHIFLLKLLNVAPQVSQLLCCSFQIEKVLSFRIVFSGSGSSIPDLGHSLSHSVSATLEFRHKEWPLRLETLQTFDHSDVQTKIQKDKKIKRQKY